MAARRSSRSILTRVVPGTKSGTLWARDFSVLGDQVVNDVLTDPSSEAVLGGQGKKQAARQSIDFKQLRAPFSVGGGKFHLKDAYMNGDQLGATMRGTVDFKSQTVDLGGTYVPLYGLNSAFRAIPILGPVLGGRQGEGLVGITFAIKGKLDDPSVLVNPMSVMTPGIFRQIFEFTGTVPDAAAAFLVLRHGERQLRPPAIIAAYTGRISAWRFLPSESLITPSGVRSDEVSSLRSSVTASSFTLMPPPLIWRLPLRSIDEAREHAGIEHAEPSSSSAAPPRLWAGSRRSRPLRTWRAPSPPRGRRRRAHAPTLSPRWRAPSSPRSAPSP